MDLHTEVTWESQANGTSKRKVGLVIEVIAPGELPTKHEPDGGPRDHESYVVEVPRSGSKGALPPKTYWPKVTGLQSASELSPEELLAATSDDPEPEPKPKARTRKAKPKAKVKTMPRRRIRFTGPPDWDAALRRGIQRGIKSGFLHLAGFLPPI
jgi:hypothetical protein